MPVQVTIEVQSSPLDSCHRPHKYCIVLLETQRDCSIFGTYSVNYGIIHNEQRYMHVLLVYSTNILVTNVLCLCN